MMDRPQREMKFGAFGILSAGIGITSVFLTGILGIFVAVLAVAAGIFGSRNGERFSLFGIIIAGIVLIFLNLQSMGLIPSSVKNADLMRAYTNAIHGSVKVFKAVKKESTATTRGEKLKARKKILQSIDESLEAARKLEATRFDPFIPGFSQHFRDEFIEGMARLKIGYSQADKVEKIKGAALLDKWGRWSRENRVKLVELWHQWHPRQSLFKTLTGE